MMFNVSLFYISIEFINKPKFNEVNHHYRGALSSQKETECFQFYQSHEDNTRLVFFEAVGRTQIGLKTIG